MKKSNLLLIGLVAIYIALALAYSVVIPPFEGLDEAEHFGVVRYVADFGALPVQGNPSLEAYHVHQEASQPPLYYMLAGPLLRLSHIATSDAPSYLVANPYVTCGAETIRANKATLWHHPFAESPPWRNALLALHLLRAFSILLQALTLIGVYAIARLVFPGKPAISLLALALTGFNPQFLIVASSVNNDNIATPVMTWALYLVVLIVQSGSSLRRALALGCLIGLATLAKLTGLLLLPLAAISYFIFYLSNSKIRPSNAGHQPLATGLWHFAITVGIALAVGGWWYARNWNLYGDPTGLAPMLDIVGRRGPVPLTLLLAELGLVFRSYWGQFPCAFFDSALYYLGWALVSILGVGGAIWGLWCDKNTNPKAAFILITWFALVLIGWLRWNLTTPAPGGRLLFTAISASSTLLAFGLAWRWPRLGYLGVVGMIGLGLLALPTWVRPLFAPPPIIEAVKLAPQHSLSAQFGDSIELLGYDLNAEQLGPGRFIDITLYWRALQPISANYVLAVQLAAPAPGDTRTLLNFNTWPGGGNLPTAAWPTQQTIMDRYRIPLPSNTGPTQAWQLQIVLYDAQANTRLPLILDGTPAGDLLRLGVYRVAGDQPTLPESARLTTPITFDQAIALTHATITEQADGIHVQLLWRSLKALPQDVTVFVHAYDATGTLVATGDRPPTGGNFGTSLWQSGDQILDTHLLTLPITLPLNSTRLTVGLYRPENGVRLQTAYGPSSERLRDDEVTISLLK